VASELVLAVVGQPVAPELAVAGQPVAAEELVELGQRAVHPSYDESEVVVAALPEPLPLL
jgi:hypothetical protein